MTETQKPVWRLWLGDKPKFTGHYRECVHLAQFSHETFRIEKVKP